MPMLPRLTPQLLLPIPPLPLQQQQPSILLQQLPLPSNALNESVNGNAEFFNINEISANDGEDGAPIIVAPNPAPSPLQTGDGALNSTPISPLATAPTNPLATTPTNPLATAPTNPLATAPTNPFATTLVNPFAMTPSNPLATHDGKRK
ncbi:uncharacterized protein EDB91DRAFT_1086486 [Suillus paluster]|uniref:uncharacterized protein n=1 Tax=Suillus paluster TaxID=48578 RepID=UPI001B880B08|nr:uncharacterized protein EDB91DRAFT_1086486 [Suillus paluster]KAG1727287.1 hypothetical protein EDB91DRAFT_1086486 [Suillus paluster]